MAKALIEVRPDSRNVMDEMRAEAVQAWKTGQPSDPLATFTFSTTAQLFAVFSPKRWELIQQLQKLGPSPIRGLARALDRDVRRVHDDVMVLLEWGIIERNEAGKVLVPYDVIHISVDIVRAAA